MRAEGWDGLEWVGAGDGEVEAPLGAWGGIGIAWIVVFGEIAGFEVFGKRNEAGPLKMKDVFGVGSVVG